MPHQTLALRALGAMYIRIRFLLSLFPWGVAQYTLAGASPAPAVVRREAGASMRNGSVDALNGNPLESVY